MFFSEITWKKQKTSKSCHPSTVDSVWQMVNKFCWLCKIRLSYFAVLQRHFTLKLMTITILGCYKICCFLLNSIFTPSVHLSSTQGLRTEWCLSWAKSSTHTVFKSGCMFIMSSFYTYIICHPLRGRLHFPDLWLQVAYGDGCEWGLVPLSPCNVYCTCGVTVFIEDHMELMTSGADSL